MNVLFHVYGRFTSSINIECTSSTSLFANCYGAIVPYHASAFYYSFLLLSIICTSGYFVICQRYTLGLIFTKDRVEWTTGPISIAKTLVYQWNSLAVTETQNANNKQMIHHVNWLTESSIADKSLQARDCNGNLTAGIRLSVSFLTETFKCVCRVFASYTCLPINACGCKRGWIPGGTPSDIKRDASASIGTRRVVDGPISGHICDCRARRCISRGSDDAAPTASSHISCRRRTATSARAWLVVPDARRGTYTAWHRLPGTLGDAAGRRHYPGPDSLYDQLGPAKCTIAPSIHKAPLAWRGDGYGCYVRFYLRNPLLFLHHNLGRQLRVRLIFDLTHVYWWANQGLTVTIGIQQYDSRLGTKLHGTVLIAYMCVRWLVGNLTNSDWSI